MPHVAELALLGAQRIFEISGAHLVRPHIPHGLVHFVERDGRIGPVLRVALGDTRPPTFDPTQPSPGPRPWLLAAEAARHAAQHSATIR